MLEQKVRQQLRQASAKQQRALQTGDIESAIMTQLEAQAVLENAAQVMGELERQEQQIVQFRLGGAKTIKCIYCEHKGQSLVEESTSVITYLIFFIIVLMTWQSTFAGTTLYFVLMLFFVLPILGGIFRIQTHSCPKCLNEVKQNSIFEKLDMDDNICDIQVSNFGMIIKRRTLLYFAVVCLVTFATYLVMSSQDLDLLQENML